MINIISKIIDNDFSDEVLKTLFNSAEYESIFKSTIIIHDNFNNLQFKNKEEECITEGSWWQFEVNCEGNEEN